MNNAHLSDQMYVNFLSDKIREWKSEFEDIEDKNLLWEIMKYKMRDATITYSKKKAKLEREMEALLKQKLDELEKAISATDVADNVWTEYEKIKGELATISEKKLQGHIVRSRAKWSEQTETNSSYFLGLESNNYTRKNINKLQINDVNVTDPKIIMAHVKEYFQTLYGPDQSQMLRDANYITKLADDIPKVSEIDRTLCDEELTLEELESTLKLMKENKTPGNDGLTVEFYRKFWPDIKQILMDSYAYSQMKGELSVSQKQAVLTLLEKRGKSRLHIKNWRPVSLLNVDYKILTKCLAERIKQVLPKIIHHTQCGFVKGRNIAEVIRCIFDVLEDTDHRNIDGMMIAVDFEKAFDSLNFDYLLQVLEMYNFGPVFIQWIKTFYKNISSCVMNNKTTSNYFCITKGVRQGDPLSPLLFIMATEIFNLNVRKDKNISGIRFGEEEIKLLSYADDTTAILTGEQDGRRLLGALEEFRFASGLKVNKEKTEGLWLGRNKNNTEKPFGIKWPKFIKVLGIFVSYDKTISIDKNYSDKITNLKNRLQMWQRRKLTINGKILIAKTFGISQILYVSSVVKAPEWARKEIDRILFEFLWNGKQHKVKKNVVIQAYADGGLSMCDFDIMNDVQYLKWVNRYFNNSESSWKHTFRSLMHPIDLTCFMKSSFMKKEILTVSEFYRNMLEIYI